jgi:predicted enzyme related to lactoylglutathione lyase
MDYWLISTGPQDKPGIDGAIMRREGPGAVERCTVDVNSMDDTIAAIIAAGGKLVQPKTPVPGIGWLIYFEDTEGNVLGAMEADPNASF